MLVESKSARDNQLGQMAHDRAREILNKVKSLYFALWQGIGAATCEQMSEFYEVKTDAVEAALRRYRNEFESDGLKTIKGKQLKDFKYVSAVTAETSKAPCLTIWTPRAALRLGMTLVESEIAKAIRTSLLDTAGAIPLAQAHELERMKLELQLFQAKQRYLDASYAIQLSTSPAMLQWLRGEAPAPPLVEYRDRFVDPATGQELGSSSGRSLTQLIADAGLNPNSKRDRQLIKKILKSNGFDHDRGQRWVSASYLREYPVLEEDLYQQALKVVLTDLGESNSQPNLFVHSLQQAALKEGNTRRSLQGEEPN